jgi:uncharacterized protein YxjI
MKEIIPNLQLPTDLTVNKIEQVVKEKMEYKLIGKFIRTPGMKLYMFNPNDGTLTACKTEKKVILTIDSKYIKKEKVEIHKDFIPFEALNDKNAIKKVKKSLLNNSSLFNLRVPARSMIKT